MPSKKLKISFLINSSESLDNPNIGERQRVRRSKERRWRRASRPLPSGSHRRHHADGHCCNDVDFGSPKISKDDDVDNQDGDHDDHSDRGRTWRSSGPRSRGTTSCGHKESAIGRFTFLFCEQCYLVNI